MQTLPITELRDTTEIPELCNRIGEPICLTGNDCGDVVVMSLEAYERDISAVKLHHALMEGVRQAKNGEYRDGKEVLAELRAKYAGK